MTGILNEWFDNLQQRVWDSISWLFSPLWRWYFLFFLLFMLCVVIAYFLNFKWVRAVLGGIVVLAGAFVAGGTVMYLEQSARMRKQREELSSREKEIKEYKKQQSPQSGGGLFDWFK